MLLTRQKCLHIFSFLPCLWRFCSNIMINKLWTSHLLHIFLNSIIFVILLIYLWYHWVSKGNFRIFCYLNIVKSFCWDPSYLLSAANMYSSKEHPWYIENGEIGKKSPNLDKCQELHSLSGVRQNFSIRTKCQGGVKDTIRIML